MKEPTHLSVNVTSGLLADLDLVVGQHRPFVKRHAAHLAALRIGIAELHQHPERLAEMLTWEQEHKMPRP